MVEYIHREAIELKRIFTAVAIVLFSLSLFGGSADVSFINPLGPTIIPIAPVLGGALKSAVPIKISLWKTTDEAVALLSKGTADFAVLPVTLGAIVYNRGIGLKLLGVYEWKVFYLVASKGAPFTGWKDLEGKSVYTPEGRGQTVDVLMRYMMSKTGVTPDKDVRIFYAPPQEIVSLFKSGKIQYAALPEPFVTMAISGGSGRIVLDFQKEWGTEMNQPGRLPVAGLFVKKSFFEQNPSVVKEVEDLFSESIEWMNANPDKAIEMTVPYLKIPVPVLEQSLKRMSFYYVPASECETEVGTFLKKINELYPEGMPKVPDKGFYAN